MERNRRNPIHAIVIRNANEEAYFAIANGSVGRLDGLMAGLAHGLPAI